MNYKTVDIHDRYRYEYRRHGEIIEFTPVDLSGDNYEVVECPRCFVLISSCRIDGHADRHFEAEGAQ